ncbi:MAG: hypothetical protein GMKNLPBB_02353 [Myxococcota bacterium]|nr:hypothetical protein [Myxococcota bacterium]
MSVTAPSARAIAEVSSPPVAGGWFAYAREDAAASIVVALVALPLCLGIAHASGAPLTSGLVAGIIGGLVVPFLSGSQLMVSGPAAGLVTIVYASISELGGFEIFLPAVALAGVFQIVMGLLKAGVIKFYFPTDVMRGMLAAIGLTLILKQAVHLVGYDADYFGDTAFDQENHENTFTAIAHAFGATHAGATIIGLLSLALLFLWPKIPSAKIRRFPAGLFVVLLGIGLNALFRALGSDLMVQPEHLVAMPSSGGPLGFFGAVVRPDFSAFANPKVWSAAFTIGLVASLESLLSLEATDRLDPWKRTSPPSRELVAQGAGNFLAGLLGGLPLTGVIVRSSANVNAGGRTRLSAVLHGIWLLVFVLLIPGALNLIPLSALAAILIHTGFKLSPPSLYREMARIGWWHWLPFTLTIVSILLTDLLVGILIGLFIGGGVILLRHSRSPVLIPIGPPGSVLQRFILPVHLSFLNKAALANMLESFPPGSRVELDARRTAHIDYDILELIHTYAGLMKERGVDLRLVGVPSLPGGKPSGH